MSSRLRKILLVLVGLLLLICVVVVAIGYAMPRRSFPDVDGEINVAGLNAPVDVYRDAFGVPHIYAENAHDLFFAQGYVHAQDRFWQMDFWRHIGSGRLAEMFGEDQLDTDRFLRSLGLVHIVEQELAAMDAETRAVMQSYADGVNAYLADHQGAALSLEYAVLRLTNSSYRPEPWQPLHTLTWGKMMAWDLGSGKLGAEIQRAILLKTITPEQLSEIVPSYPNDHPLIVPGFDLQATSEELQPGSLATLLKRDSLGAALEEVARQVEILEPLLGQASEGLGSNSWAIGGGRTATGKPFLANDMHLSVQMPSIWYEVGLHCAPKTQECPYEVTGFSFAGVPAVVVGHNADIAWGDTNLSPDVIDLYIEKINPQNPHQYEVNGEWVDMELVQETILVAGGEAVEMTARYTRHGPIISDTYGSLEGFADQAGIDLPQPYAIAMRWTALEPNQLVRAILGFNRARNWEEFRQAVGYFAVPSQNMVYADVNGNIGYHSSGWIPMRLEGHDGSLPVPGWTDVYEWQGYIPFEQLPYSYNPPEGYVATANNAVVGTDYPYLINLEWDWGFRARRIVDMIEAAPEPITLEYVQQMHADNKDLLAEVLVPILLALPLTEGEEDLQEARGLLAGWDFQMHMDAAAPALYNAFWSNLLAATFHDDLPQDFWPDGGSRWAEVVRNLLEQPDSPWWDNQSTSSVEGRQEIFTQAFVAAVTELQDILGKDPDRWTWGDLHTVTFRNQSLGESGIAPVEALFNRGPFRTSGGSITVNATGWNAAPNEDGKSYQVMVIPSERMIVDLGDLQNSLSIISTGQSGHAYHPYYIDMADLWRNIQYHPMYWERAPIEQDAEDHLRLLP